MAQLPNSPECNSSYTYEEGHFYICPECAHEWSDIPAEEESRSITRDAHGTELNDGDNVTVIKYLHVNGSSIVVKQGTNIKDIKIIEGDHDIDCKVPGHCSMQLKLEFLKKIDR